MVINLNKSCELIIKCVNEDDTIIQHRVFFENVWKIERLECNDKCEKIKQVTIYEDYDKLSKKIRCLLEKCVGISVMPI